MKLRHCFPFVCLGLAAACNSDSAGPPEPPVDAGHMRVQISGAVQLTSEWQAFGVQLWPLGGIPASVGH